MNYNYNHYDFMGQYFGSHGQVAYFYYILLIKKTFRNLIEK